MCADLKKIYGAVNLDDAEYAKEEFREKWDKKYPNILKSWDKNWSELTTFFEYPQEIRKIIYIQRMQSKATTEWSENSPNPRQFFRLMIRSEKSFL